MEERLDAFADRINTVLAANNHHEVMVVGHSVGAILAVPAVARTLAKNTRNKPLTLLTLGECIPLLSFLPQAHDYREELAYMAHAPRLFWADFTSPIDGACFPLVNPVSASDIILQADSGPLILSTRFHTLFEPKHYQAIRRNWYRIHFQYLMATDFSGLFDFFAMTAGFENLAERIAHHNAKTSVV
jgi:pimeloyl-ACP methyl ester carboxylesterase